MASGATTSQLVSLLPINPGILTHSSFLRTFVKLPYPILLLTVNYTTLMSLC